jgi:hypothetical protein
MVPPVLNVEECTVEVDHRRKFVAELLVVQRSEKALHQLHPGHREKVGRPLPKTRTPAEDGRHRIFAVLLNADHPKGLRNK